MTLLLQTVISVLGGTYSFMRLNECKLINNITETFNGHGDIVVSVEPYKL